MRKFAPFITDMTKAASFTIGMKTFGSFVHVSLTSLCKALMKYKRHM
jgi:hypothetical protein